MSYRYIEQGYTHPSPPLNVLFKIFLLNLLRFLVYQSTALFSSFLFLLLRPVKTSTVQQSPVQPRTAQYSPLQSNVAQ